MRRTGLAAAALLLCGCSATPAPTPAGTGTPPVSPAATPATTSAAPTGPAHAPTLPSGWRYVSAPKAQVRLGVPPGYVVLEAATLRTAQGRKNVEELAQRQGLSVEEVTAQLETVDVIASDGTHTITALPLKYLPTQTELKDTYPRLGATDVTVETRTTATTGGYTLTFKQQGRPTYAYFAVTSRKTPFNILVTGPDVATARRLGEEVLRSLATS